MFDYAQIWLPFATVAIIIALDSSKREHDGNQDGMDFEPRFAFVISNLSIFGYGLKNLIQAIGWQNFKREDRR